MFSRNFAGQNVVSYIFKALKRKSLQPKLLYTARLSFRIEGKIKILNLH